MTPDFQTRGECQRIGAGEGGGLERVKGIEPSSSAWKAVALPLSYTRDPAVQVSRSPRSGWRLDTDIHVVPQPLKAFGPVER